MFALAIRHEPQLSEMGKCCAAVTMSRRFPRGGVERFDLGTLSNVGLTTLFAGNVYVLGGTKVVDEQVRELDSMDHYQLGAGTHEQGPWLKSAADCRTRCVDLSEHST